MNATGVNAFRDAPLGWWSTGETVPWGEKLGFYPNGIGVHEVYSGLGCNPWYFEWEPARNWAVRVRWLGQGEEVPPDEWDYFPFTIGPGIHYDRPALWLTTVGIPVVGRDTLWYVGPAVNGPASRWQGGSNRGGTGGRRPVK